MRVLEELEAFDDPDRAEVFFAADWLARDKALQGYGQTVERVVVGLRDGAEMKGLSGEAAGYLAVVEVSY